MTRPAARRVCAAVLALAALATGTPARSATLFGLIDTGEIFRSTDDGASWDGIATLPVSDAVALSARFTASDLFLVTRSGGVYRSLDAGTSWTPVGAITANDVQDLVIRPDGALMVLTGTGSLYESADQGVSFTPLAALTASNFRSLTVTRPAVRYYALTATGEIYESTNGGAGWTPAGAIPMPDARRIRAVGNTLFVMSGAGDIYRSLDAGVKWTPVGTLSQVGMRGLVENSGTIAAATREGHVATSATGEAWVWQGSINQLDLTALASDDPATTSVEVASGPGFDLAPPYPNPSSGGATFVVRLQQDSDVRLALYDVSGRLVAARAPERLAAGRHAITWRPEVRTAGVYFARIETARRSATRRWLITR